LNSRCNSTCKAGALTEGVGDEYGGNIMYEHGKMRPVETDPGIGGEGIKESDGGGEFNCDIS
jgi:hypothetical protein